MSGSKALRWSILAVVIPVASACNQGVEPTAAPGGSTTFTSNPCVSAASVQLAVAQATRIDCSNGGTTVTLAGNGASYLIVPQFATDQVANQFYSYSMATGNVAAASVSASRLPAARRAFAAFGAGAGMGVETVAPRPSSRRNSRSWAS